ncbi:MAG: amidohydrolase family protein [Bacillota bacterium]|jgi:imidazolonepropionase-like amidohydrolase
MAIAIKNATLFDGSGKAPWGPVTVLVEDDTIKTIRPAAEFELGEGIEIIDAQGKFLMPGLIDSHVHITGSGDPNVLKAMKQSIPFQALKASLHAKATLEAGFTAIRDAGAGFLVDVALKQAIDQGLIPGPRMHVACHSLSITGGHGDTRNGWPPHVEFLGRMVVDSPTKPGEQRESSSAMELITSSCTLPEA